METLPCPECLKEMQHKDLIVQGDCLVCPQCSREIYQRKHTQMHLICPKCGETTDADYFHTKDH